MIRAIAGAANVRCITSPNPWVGAVVRTEAGTQFEGATGEPGTHHAEAQALERAGDEAAGATMYVTLEPCAHIGKTPACVKAIIEAGVTRVVIGMEDPDPLVSGKGIAQLRAAGIAVDIGLFGDRVRAQLAPYVKHRTTGRPWVVLKLAASIDGGTAAPDGSSQWITHSAARADGHRLRAESDAILIGAGTVRFDNPSLTVRDYKAPVMPKQRSLNPTRIVLGSAPPEANVQPCIELRGSLDDILDDLGSQGVLSVLVEGGAQVAGDFHRCGLVDRYVIYLAPAMFGGSDAPGLFAGAGAYSISEIWRGRFVSVERVGADLRVELEPRSVDDDLSQE